MAEYIEREALIAEFKRLTLGENSLIERLFADGVYAVLETFPAADVVEVVRCHDYIHAVPLERNCELNTCQYMHCNLWRGDETKNVWHKYQRFYKDYSIVEHDDFCSYGERKE